MPKQPTFSHVFDEKLSRCLVCGGSCLVDHKRDYRNVLIVRCGSCQFQFMNPQYEDNYIRQFYDDFYVDGDESKAHEAEHEYNFDYYLRLLEKRAAVGELLDVGCGSGSMLAVAKRRGWNVSGYDVDFNSTRAVAARLGEERIFSGDFLQLDETNKYDVITLHQVLEHIKSPNEYLQKLGRLLKDGGYLFVAVPNIHSISKRTKFMLEAARIRRKNVGKYYDTYHHLLYFTPGTLRELLSRHNFAVEFGRHCHKSKIRESGLLRFLKNQLSERIIPTSAFFVIAKKS